MGDRHRDGRQGGRRKKARQMQDKARRWETERQTRRQGDINSGRQETGLETGKGQKRRWKTGRVTVDRETGNMET